jgi:Heparinase II/III-like protein/Heparinase II/III N-terminus
MMSALAFCSGTLVSKMSEDLVLDDGSLRAIVDSVNARPLAPFEYTEIKIRPSKADAAAQADRLLSEGFSLAGGNIPSLVPPLRWSGFQRSFEFHLHALQPIKILLVAYDLTLEQRYFEAAQAVALDWIEQNSPEPDIGNVKKGVSTALSDPHPSRWYDMAIAQRLQALAYLFDASARMDPRNTDRLRLYAGQIFLHHAVLSKKSVFASDSNHGFYQAISQFSAATRLPELDPDAAYARLARQRLIEMLNNQFTADQIHKEHSPGYHYMLCVTLANAAGSGLFDSEIQSLFKGYEETLSEMFKPNFSIATIGDTDPRHLPSQVRDAAFFSDEKCRYIASAGDFGLSPRPEVKAFLHSGYAFARLYALDVDPVFKNFSYLAQIAGFHSRVHKHADHLSFIWYDCGRDILIDPGRYGYVGSNPRLSKLFQQGFWYSDPKRIYVESTRAHNCVEIDGASYPRKNVKPFGSALIYAGEQDGLAVTVCELTHPGAIRHRRVLIMSPGRFLLELDFLHDRFHQHDYRQWFQFAPEWQVESGADGVSARAPAWDDKPAAALRVFNLLDENTMGRPQRGQEEPHLQGWHSDAANSLTPSVSLAVEAPDRKMGRFATLLVLDEGAQLVTEAIRFDATLRSGTVAWTDRHGSHVLTIAADEAGVAWATLGDPELVKSKTGSPVKTQGLKRGFLQRILDYLRP